MTPRKAGSGARGWTALGHLLSLTLAHDHNSSRSKTPSLHRNSTRYSCRLSICAMRQSASNSSPYSALDSSRGRGNDAVGEAIADVRRAALFSWIASVQIAAAKEDSQLRPVQPLPVRKPRILRQAIRDFVPRRLRADEDVFGRANAWGVDEGAHGDMGEGAVADDRVEQRAALAAAGVVVAVRIADGEAAVGAGDQLQLVDADAGEGLVRRTGGAPAVRAMAVGGILEGVGDLVADGAAGAAAGELAGSGGVGAHRAFSSLRG